MCVGVILFAEDDDDQAFLFERAWLKSGCGLRLVRVSDGDGILEYCENRGRFADKPRFPQPDIIISDLNMPRGGGLFALDWLKSRDLLRATTFVMLTSSDEVSQIKLAISKGAHAYVVKAMTCDQMADWLRETILAATAHELDEHGWLKCPHNACRDSPHSQFQ